MDFLFQTPLHVSGCPDPRDVTRFDRSYYDLPVPKFKVIFLFYGKIDCKSIVCSSIVVGSVLFQLKK